MLFSVLSSILHMTTDVRPELNLTLLFRATALFSFELRFWVKSETFTLHTVFLETENRGTLNSFFLESATHFIDLDTLILT